MMNRDEQLKTLMNILSRKPRSEQRSRALQLITSTGNFSTVDDSDIEYIRRALLDELIEFGLGEDDEPNSYGYDLESLIDWASDLRERGV